MQLAEYLEDVGLLWALLLPHYCSCSHPSQCFVGTVPDISPPPCQAQCLRVLLHQTWITNPHLVPVAVSRDQLWLFQRNQQLSPSPAWESALWRAGCAQPKTSLSFSSSHVKLFKRPLSAASICNGCQVLFLSDSFVKFVQLVAMIREVSLKSNHKHLINNSN